MKPFEYYTSVSEEIPRCDYEDSRAYRDMLYNEIDTTPMTAKEREEQRRLVTRKVNEYADEKNRSYDEACKALKEEFWRDVRADIGYTVWLDSEGAETLEELAEKIRKMEKDTEEEDIYDSLVEMNQFFQKIFRNSNLNRLNKK
jgi:hypothetical protein